MSALVSDLPSRNGWSVAEHAGDRTPDRSQRLLSRASWDEAVAMSQVRKYAAAGLDEAARRSRRRRMTVGALDETGQEKQGTGTAGVKRQYMGCAAGSRTVSTRCTCPTCGRRPGHALIGARQWIPAEDIADPVKSLVSGPALGPAVPDEGTAGHRHPRRTRTPTAWLRLRLRGRGLRQLHGTAGVPGGPRAGLRAARRVLLHGHARRRDQDDLRGRGEEAAEGQERLGGPLRGKGSKGERWYAWAWIGTASPRHSLLVRRHLKTGELAFHYCFVPEGQLASKARLIRAAGLRWPVEESFELGKGCFGLDQCQARLYTAILRHIVLVMAALAICAVTAAQLRDRTDAQAPPPASPDRPPADPGLIPLTVREVKRLLAAALTSRNRPATPPAGSTGAAATRHDPAGSTNAHAWHATTPWSASNWRLPY